MWLTRPHAGSLDQLLPEQQAFLNTWRLSVTLDVEGLGKALFCHANPQDDITVFTERTPDERVLEVLGNFSAASTSPSSGSGGTSGQAELIICGHTHMQFDRTVEGTRIINAGSVGMPFGATGAHWLLLDSDIHFKRTEYDYEQAAEQIRSSKLP